MFERYLTDALTTNFGHFVDNLDADKVRLSAWNGELVLQDLSLRPNALEHLVPDCPVELTYGRVGHLELRIPWSLFRSQLRWKSGQQAQAALSCSIVLSDVNILITPRRRRGPEQQQQQQQRPVPSSSDEETAKNDGDDNDESLEEKRIHKEKQVQSLLDGHLLRRVTESSVSSSRSWNWVQKLLSTLLSTLSVTVRNIHVRYEDPGTCMGFVWDGQPGTRPELISTSSSHHHQKVPRSIRQYRPSFAVGITLQQFSVEADEDGRVLSEREETKEGEGKDELRTASSNDVPTTTTTSTTTRRIPYEFRKKVAAAERLAVYWDSDCNLMAVHSEILCCQGGGDAANGETTIMEYSSYYQSAFQIANSQNTSSIPTETTNTTTTTTTTATFGHESLYNQRHSYVLDPISPSINLALVAQKDDAAASPMGLSHATSKMDSIYSTDDSDDSNDGSTTTPTVGPQQPDTIPPSSMRIHLPPCKFTLARSTLEDTAYIRKSLSIWRHATKGILSEASLRRLAKLRPHHSPKQDPRGWWFYAVQATLVLSKGNQNREEEERRRDLEEEDSSKQGVRRRRRGWKGFWDAFQRRKRYVDLYQSLVAPRSIIEEGPDTNSAALVDPPTANQQLLEMEDQLTTDEIVAFRLALYETWRSATPLLSHHHHHTTPTKEEVPIPKSGWQLWSGSAEKRKDNVLEESEQDILSLNHRISMMQEMSQALERERANVRKSVKEEVRQASKHNLSTVDWQDNGNDDDDDDTSNLDEDNPVVWKASVACREIAIQVNDESSDSSQNRTSPTPVVRFSCAWVQDQCWYQDDSWDIDCSLASLLVKDLTVSKDNLSHGYFPNLVARKRVAEESANDADFMWIEGIQHHKGLSIAVQRRLHWNRGPENELVRDMDRGSTTTSRIRILPMEVVYSTVPVEVATRVLGTVKTPELVDDYHRMAAAAHGWQQRQKKKFLAALAHKRKKIVVDIDVGAPELLIPEDINHPESPMLAIDLGRLRVFNDEASMEPSLDYDDQWRLVLSNIQVRSATVASFGQELSADLSTVAQPIQSHSAPRHLVEPFSLDFAVSTKIASEDSEDRTKVCIAATLPRLAFNLNSSSIRLVSRLQTQFENRRNRKNASTLQVPSTLIVKSSNHSVQQGSTAVAGNSQKASSEGSAQQNSSSREIQFDFTAPIVSLRLANDTDNIQRFGETTDSTATKSETPLLDLAFRGIRGTVLQESTAVGEFSTLFDARLHSLGVIDLYQTAGHDFSLLMSSAPPEKLDGLVFNDEKYSWVTDDANKSEIWSGKDLVTIRYSSTSAKGSNGESMPNKLAIGFHELYVEWNPETFATIQKAVRIPDEEIDRPINFVKTPERSPEKESVSEDEFFDAMENATFDSVSDVDSFPLVSEVASSSFETAEPDFQGSVRSWDSFLGIQHSLSNTAVNPLSPPRMAHSSITPLSPHNGVYPIRSYEPAGIEPPEDNTPVLPRGKAFELVFELSKLRMSFNKEARHRKVMIAQMDGTSVSYKTRASGGSKTKLNIGNLVFIDPESSHNSTLYSQILGLNTRTPDQHSQQLSSLLEMEILINPKTRSFETVVDLIEDKPENYVVIDRDRGVAIGCNNFVRAKFSPMRFVFLEQLWFEFIDYFFEGLIGTAVWGGTNKKPPVPPLLELGQDLPGGGDYLPGSDAKGFNFTRFDIELESPELLFPVTYRSPHFLRLDLGSIHVSNKYDGTLIEGGNNMELNARMQWFNNCSIAMKELRIFSWSGKELGQNPIVVAVALRWPTGPTAPLVTPKWRVNCNFDSLDIALRRTDYALVQHILSHNIGEQSRNLNEWQALQRLSPADFLAYSESILVHFGYDKKDVTPTTYDLKISIPSVSVQFIESEDELRTPVAVARCIDLLWSLSKDADLVVQQKATFDVSLVAPSSSSNFEKLLSSWKYDQDTLMEDFETDENDDIPELTYTSTSLPCGDNTKTLEIVDACIYSDVRAWRRLSGFFSTLPEPTMFNETEIATLIQVGDRWYKIGSTATPNAEKMAEKQIETDILPWIKSFPGPKIDLSTKLVMHASQAPYSPSFQMRLSLTAPRIILSSDPADGAVSRLVLRMSHLDFLHVNSGKNCRVTRSFLLDEVEVYTLSSILSERRKREDGNSLIHPWSIGGEMEKCNGNSKGNCEKHSTRISADLLQARAAYSDMAVAIEVCLCVAHSAKADGQDGTIKSTSSGSLSDSSSRSGGTEVSPGPSIVREDDADQELCAAPDFSLFDVEFDGFELLVKDDSGRHFATNQDLIILSLGKTLFGRRGRRGKPSSMNLRLEGFDLFDCLQTPDSPFRTAATTRSGTTGLDRKEDSESTREADRSDKSPAQRRFDWNDSKMRSVGDFKFGASPALVQRLDAASGQCSSALERNQESKIMSPSRVIEVLCILDGQKMQEYHAKLCCLSVQWNPSTIIAIQRFLGRLRKESKSKIVQVFHNEVDEMIAAKSIDFSDEIAASPADSDSPETSSIQATIEFQELKVCLNKEHQNRRLLELTLSACRLDLNASQKGTTVYGRVGSLTAWDSDNYYSDGIQTENRHVVKTIPSRKSSDGQSDFLSLRYRTFRGPHSQADTDALPAWVRSRISEIGGIDDFLSVRVAATELTYLKERTDELIDYLSNGLPGKGMGVTSRAAKGFIKKRILTQSFLEFQNDSPQVFVPQHERCTDGIALKLGDVNVRSYFEDKEGGTSPDWWRILSLELSGFQVGVREEKIFSPATNPIDLRINLRRPTTKGGELSIRGELSFVDLVLKYSDYMLIRCVASDNLGRKVDTEKWDNIEKAYWSEEIGIENAIATFSVDDDDLAHVRPTENRVAYSSNARFVRYGKAGKMKQRMERKNNGESNAVNVSPSRSFEKSSTSIDVKFVLDGLSLKLTRDDRLDEIGDEDLASAFCYDIILLRVQLVEMSASSTVTGDLSFHLSLFRLGLFDLGDTGRSTRERYYASLSRASPRKGSRKGPRRPCPFYVIAEGYAPDSEGNRTSNSDLDNQDGPQFVVTVERCPVSSAQASGSVADLELPPHSKVTIASIVVNYLSLNLLIRPLKEAMAFLACEWPLPKHNKRNSISEPDEEAGHAESGVSKRASQKAVKNEGLHLKLVANYPRIFFLADESDPNSRALVLRGLAVVNMSKVTRVDDADIKRVMSAKAQLHSMESYINADVNQALCFKPSHVEMVGELNARSFPRPEEGLNLEADNSLGVALIQPVTAGIEFCEVRRDRFPTKRSAIVNIEPVSTMLSFEDLNLIETVLARLSSARSSSSNNSQEMHGDELLSIYSVASVSPSSRGASRDEGAQGGTYEVTFKTQRLGLGLKSNGGMTVVSSVQSPEHGSIEIGDSLIAIGGVDCFCTQLEDVVKRLSTTTRPISLRFFHPENKVNQSDIPGKEIPLSSSRESSKIDEAKEFSVSTYKINFKKEMKNGLELERSSCGGFPVVTRVSQEHVLSARELFTAERYDGQVETTLEGQSFRSPRPGAVVVAVNDVPIQEFGVEEIWTQIANVIDASADDSADESAENVHTYSLSFLEIDSELWGKVESIDIASSGFALSFIDDLKGRDMPLFRGQLNALEIHAERGLGGHTQIIEVQPSSILNLEPNVFRNEGSIASLNKSQVADVRSESVVTLSGIAMCSVDYFHPRIAFWEPLVEPSQLFLLLEKQSGCQTTMRPGQVAVELSDRLLREQSFRANALPSIGASPQMVTFNLTDSSAEVAVKALSQWKEWRKSKLILTEDDDPDEFQEDAEVELHEEFNPLADENAPLASPLSGMMLDEEGFGGSPRLELRTESRRDAKRAAAQKAAQAALVFAQKRGADRSKKGDSAKPFVLRNRTGVSIAFVQQDSSSNRSTSQRNVHPQKLSVVGEYTGLAEYDPTSIHELADKEDARFSMEILSDDSSRDQAVSNKVRNYEGRFPGLTVAIQAVSGVFIQPLVDLQVYKVGSTVRHLTVRKDAERAGGQEKNDSTEYSIPVVWKVEIEDNRRVLTLSTAVRVVTTAFATEMEIGVQRMAYVEPLEKTLNSSQAITSIGIVRPESPFYLPLWLALKLEAVSIFVRPRPDGSALYGWGRSSILRFAPFLSLADGSDNTENAGTWVWEETFEELDYIHCDGIEEDSSPVWLAVFSGSSSNSAEQFVGSKLKKSASTMNYEEEHHGVISVTLDSNVTIRNMLPMSVDWQIAHVAYGSASPAIVDGSHARSTTSPSLPHKNCLNCGECTEVFACDYETSELQARFKEPDGHNWSGWAPLGLEGNGDFLEKQNNEEDDENVKALFPRSSQVNVQVTNDSFGVPLTFGVRIVPKMTLGSLDEPVKTQIYGIEIIVYAELWIRNITSLPLNFGCPSYQVHGTGGSTDEIFDETATLFTAESALMEISSLLEVGDKGMGLSKKAAREVAATGSIECLPNQECDEIWEEVFEYLEIAYSTVKRRWWASESYDSFRMNITVSNENGRWHWLGENWSIDTAGEVNASLGGWESSRNLLGGAGSFSGNRTFDSSHSIRRRRYFRNRSGHRVPRSQFEARQTVEGGTPSTPLGCLHGGLQAFHQPLNDSFSREQNNILRGKKRKNNTNSKNGEKEPGPGAEASMQVAVKCAGGKWSLPVTIPDTGTSHGAFRVLASRWPALTIARNNYSPNLKSPTGTESRGMNDVTSPFHYRRGDLTPRLFELCYTVSDVEGEWGEFSRSMVVSPRFMVRNDSTRFSIEVKQAGTSDSTSLKLIPGASEPFYWEDFRLPGLLCTSPCVTNDEGRSVYKWSGGFDICNLGMVPLRIRRGSAEQDDANHPVIRSMRALVEIRPGTGGFGINISFREEDPVGDGSLFRIENLSPFPIWLSQDGVLANPSKQFGRSSFSRSFADSAGADGASKSFVDDFEANGDLIRPSEKCTFALDVPYRQGKYAHRKEATLKELLRVRIALAPLAHRAGIETVKVVAMTNVGESIRLNPSKLYGILDDALRTRMYGMRIVAVLCSDGPTRVLKLSLAKVSDQDVIGTTIREVSYMASMQNPSTPVISSPTGRRERLIEEIKHSATSAFTMYTRGQLPDEDQVKREAIFSALDKQTTETLLKNQSTEGAADGALDQIYSIRAEFSGFLFSLVDSTPSEIAVATLRNFNALARWNGLRTNEASLMLSVGWLQVDNHVPSAPFKVALKPDTSRRNEMDSDSDGESGSTDQIGASPLLMVAVAFAPKHKSGIVCVRSVTIAPRNLVIAVDLAFLVRLQRFFMDLKGHFRRGSTEDGSVSTNAGALLLYGEQKRNIIFPHFDTAEEDRKRAAAFGTENQNLYFQGLTILPAAITLSVAPARALTPAQASLEGKEVAAIHQAVRKGDVLVGSSSALLGVRVGRKNTTPLAVVRGVFKSIVVDALLRLDGASLNFSGVFLRNHISTGPQLTTYLLTHYLASLRQNVPALLGSLAAFGNPLGLIRGLGDGMSDFVSQPVQGLKKSVKELDPTYLVDGVARGTGSLARHAVGGFADSASLLTETFSKNMAVLTLDRRYAQKRDRSKQLRLNSATTVTLAGGVESGFVKLVQGFMEGVTGVVKAPMRGAEKRGIEGFAKGIGKGLLGLLVKPIIGISDAATDVMIGVKNSVENASGDQQQNLTLDRNQYRPRRPMYGRDRVLRPYKLEDAAAAALMLRTRCAGENYLSHLDMGDRVAMLSVRRMILLGPKGQELMALKYKHVSKAEVRQIPNEDNSIGWAIIIVLNTPRKNGSEVEVLSCTSRQEAEELCAHLQRGIDLVASDRGM